MSSFQLKVTVSTNSLRDGAGLNCVYAQAQTHRKVCRSDEDVSPVMNSMPGHCIFMKSSNDGDFP